MRSKTLLIILLCFCYVYGKSIHRRTFTRKNVTSPAEGGGDATKKKKSVSYRPSHLDNGEPSSDTTFDTFEESPILWTAYHHNNAVGSRKSRQHNKNKAKCGKGDACSRSGWEEVDEDSMPSTANPNPNIFGGFPENDVWGNFELPPPAELEKLKEHLKQPANRKIANYGDEQEPDEIGQMYNYENHALPEYDIMDTPSLQELMAQHIKQKASCAEAACTNKLPTQSTCDHFNALCAVNAKHPKGGAPEYEGPCASKILEMFGCKPKSSVEAAEPAAAAKTNNAVKLVTSPLKLVTSPQKLVTSPVKAGNKTAKSVKLKDFDKTVEASIKSTEKELNKVIQSMNLLKPQQQPEARPSPAPLKHKKLKSQDGNKRLIKEDDSLALMAALGNDLQKNFAKLQFSDKTNNTNQQTNTTQLDNKNTTLGHGTTDKSDDKTTTEDADAALTEGKEIPLTNLYELRNFYEISNSMESKATAQTVDRHETKEFVEVKENEVRPY